MQKVLSQVQNLWKPPTELKISEWADEYRYLSPESSAVSGKYRTDYAPYQKEIMDVARQATIGIGIVFTIVVLCIITYVAFAEEIDTAECMVFKPKYYMICMNEGHEYALIEQQLDILEYKRTYIIIKENPNGIDSTNRTCD